MQKSPSAQQLYPIYVGKKSLTLSELSIHEYLEAVQFTSILSQATKIFLRKNGLSPQNTIQEFLSQCNKGQHVLLKSFGSFQKQTINRMCFLYNFLKIFEVENNQRNGLDYYQLFRLLCSDFPKEIVVKSVNLVNQNTQNDLAKILNSRKFINSLYLNFIHTEYLDAMYNEVFEGKAVSVPFVVLAEWVYQKEKNMFKIHDKPLFSSVIQAILNQIRKKGVINQIIQHKFPSSKDENRKVVFLNDKTCIEFIRRTTVKKAIHKNQSPETYQQQSETNKIHQQNFNQPIQIEAHNKITYEQFLRQIINQVEYHKWVKENLEMFDNSIIWAVETYKVLLPKENPQAQQPINQKKMKKK